MSESKSVISSSISEVVSSSSNNTRGIPSALFIEDVQSYLTSKSTNAEQLLKSLHTLYGKYKFMESQLVSQQKQLLIKIPDINSALSALQYLIKNPNKTTKAHFELSDSVYAQAKIMNSTNRVLLWLGANVMLEYNYIEAEELLLKNKKNAEINLNSLEADLEFLKDQITISEVNIARVHNYKVTLKQQQNKIIQQEKK